MNTIKATISDFGLTGGMTKFFGKGPTEMGEVFKTGIIGHFSDIAIGGEKQFSGFF